MRILFHICRIIVSLLFILSGFTKAIDPQGTAIKFREYFQALGIDFLNDWALAFSILLNALEFLVGFVLLFQSNIKISSLLALVLMILFIPLTLFLAITGKVADCGCFGDAIKLSDWETFYKNLVLIIPILIVYVFHKKFPSRFSQVMQTFIASVGLVFIAWIIWFGLIHLPIIDFRPFHIGANITEGIEIPIDKIASTKKILIYEKNGVKREFDESYYPWKDTTWHFVETKTEVTGETYDPPIKDFFIEHPEHGGIEQQILNDEQYTFLLISNDIDKGRWKNLDKIMDIAHFSVAHNIAFYGVTSSSINMIEQFTIQHGLNFQFCQADEKLLKTIIRTNPGLLLLRKGTVLGKWSYADIPDITNMSENLNSFAISQQQRQKNKLKLFTLFGVLFLIVFLVLYYFKK